MYVTITISNGLYLTPLEFSYLIPSIIWYNESLHNAINGWYLNGMKRRTIRETQNDMLETQNLPLLSFRGNSWRKRELKIICCKHKIYHFKVLSGVYEEGRDEVKEWKLRLFNSYS